VPRGFNGGTAVAPRGARRKAGPVEGAAEKLIIEGLPANAGSPRIRLRLLRPSDGGSRAPPPDAQAGAIVLPAAESKKSARRRLRGGYRRAFNALKTDDENTARSSPISAASKIDRANPRATSRISTRSALDLGTRPSRRRSSCRFRVLDHRENRS